MIYFDTHCHLNFDAFKDDFLDASQRAKKEGVAKIIVVGSNAQTSKKAVKISREINEFFGLKFAFAAVGIHPTHFDQVGFDEIEKLAEMPDVVAIGETGLDFFRNQNNIGEQKELFAKHINLAKKLNKPLIFHNRLADEEVWEIIEKLKPPKGVFHCFSSDHKFAARVISSGFLISFTGNITYGNKKLKKVIERTPLEKIMIETDAPYIVPEPLRSRGIEKNEPAYVIEVAKKIAAIKDLDLKIVADQTSKNAKEFFGL